MSIPLNRLLAAAPPWEATIPPFFNTFCAGGGRPVTSAASFHLIPPSDGPYDRARKPFLKRKRPYGMER